jgi:hypothetical protein
MPRGKCRRLVKWMALVSNLLAWLAVVYSSDSPIC